MPQVNTPPPNAELWTIAQTCTRLSVCRRTVYHWLQRGKVDYVRTPSGPVRIISSSVFQQAHNSK